MPIVLKFGSINLLQPSGPVQACNGIALPCIKEIPRMMMMMMMMMMIIIIITIIIIIIITVNTITRIV